MRFSRSSYTCDILHMLILADGVSVISLKFGVTGRLPGTPGTPRTCGI
jgi:hypothetical protein